MWKGGKHELVVEEGVGGGRCGVHGGDPARDFLRFLSDELQPWVEGHYRTQPFSVLVGHSLGVEDHPRAFEMALDTPDPGVYNFKANLDRMTAQLDAGEQCPARGAGTARE